MATITFQSAVVNINNTTEATSTTDGSLQTDGGLSVVKSVVIGDDLDLLSNGAILKVGNAQPFTLTHSNANNTLLASADHRLAFGDNGEYIYGNGTDLKIISSGDLDITATLVDVTGALTTSGISTLGGTTGATVSAAGIVNVNNTTEATSATDGSLQTDGGLSVAKSAVIGDDLDLLSNSAIFKVGVAQPFTLTHSNANNTLLASANHRLAFGDNGEYIYGNGTDLKIISSGDLDITATLVDVTGALTTSGISTLGGTTGATVSAAGIVNVNNTTEATSATDGSLQTDGGLSVAKSAVIGDDLDLLSNGAIFKVGVLEPFTLTHSNADNTLLASADHRLAFGDNGEYIYGNGTDLKIISSGDLDITATLVDVTGALTTSGISTLGGTTGATVSAAGIVNVNNTTEATSATDGSLQTDGGLSVAKSAVIGDDLDLLSNGAVFKVGVLEPFTLTHSNADNTLLASADHRLAFGDNGEYIYGNGTDLKIISSGDLDITATLVDVTGALTTSGISTLGGTTGATVSAAGIVNVNNTTEATSATDGSLQTDGGLSVAKSAVIGDDLDLLSNGAVFKVGSAQPFTLTHSNANNTLLTSADHRLAFGDNGEYIYGNGTDLKIISSGDLDITATLVDVTGALTTSGISTLGGTTGATVSAAGIVNVNNTTEATSATDGSLQTDGGLSVAKSAVIGDDLDLLSNSAVFKVGSDQPFTLTHSNADNTLLASTSHRLAFGTNAEYIYGDGSDLNIISSGDLDITATLVDVTGALTTSGISTLGGTTGATVSAAGIVNVNNTTEATSATDGSLQTDGGLSVAKSAVIGDDLDLLSNSAIFKVGVAQPFTLTHSNANNTLLASASHRLAFGDNGEYIYGDGTDLKIISSGDLDITATLVDVTGALTTSGISTLGGTTGATVSAAGIVNVNNTTDSSSTTTGSLQTDGGLGVAKTVYVGETLRVTGLATVGGTLAVTGDTTITGDLTVNGTTTTVNSTIVDVSDNVFRLAANAAAAVDFGITGKVYVDGTDDTMAGMIYDNSTSYFRMFKGADWSPDDSSGNAFLYNGAALTAVMDTSDAAWAGLHAGAATFHCDIDEFTIKKGSTDVPVLTDIIKSLNRLYSMINASDASSDPWLVDSIRFDTDDDDETAVAEDIGVANLSDGTQTWVL